MAEPAVAQTHVSTVFFSADRAFKLLKPIRTSFLDFSTTERRLVAIDEELRLNRRLAPDVYLGSADVIEDGQLVDRMLVMRRMPTDRRLTHLVTSPVPGLTLDDWLRRIMHVVAGFHASMPPITDARDIAGRDAVARNWDDNVADMSSLVGEVFDEVDFARVATLAGRYLDHSEALFDRRLAEGHVRDGHGDLTAEDIFCLDDGPRILDCLAFDERLRIADVLCDVAFLAMDMDRLAGPAAAAAIWAYYREFTNEHHPASLANHYMAYRAHVRAKVAGIRHRQGDPDAAPLARSYLQLCLRRLDLARRRVVVVGGAPGTGKTTVAGVLSSERGWSLIGSDQVRKELTGRATTDRDFADVGSGIYDRNTSARTYGELFRRAGLLLERGESVVLDASFGDAERRADARRLVREHGAELTEIECVLDQETARTRVAQRIEAGTDASDARPAILEELWDRHARWPEATTLSTAGSADDVRRRALGLVAS